jgi:putative flippase GtrA
MSNLKANSADISGEPSLRADTRRMPNRPSARQFGQYAIVGVFSLMVGSAVFNACYFLTHWLVLSTALSYIISVINGFVLNRRWTFREHRSRPLGIQSARFTVVNLIGWALNTAIIALLLATYAHVFFVADRSIAFSALLLANIGKHGGGGFSFLVVNGCGLIATAFVTVWNFFANRYWTFGS